MGRLRDYFKSLFGFPEKSLPPNELPREIHEDFHQQFGHNFELREFPDPPMYEQHNDIDIPEHDIVILEGQDMFREMESMFENFFKGFPFTFHSPPEGFFDPSIGINKPPSDEPGQQHQDEPSSLRDKMLKQPDSDIYQEFHNHGEEHGAPGMGPHSWFGGLWKLPFRNITKPEDKIDKDLDSEVESGKQSLDDILSQRENSLSVPPNSLRPRSSSSSFSKVTTMDSEGRTESRTTRKDSSGREEVTVSRKIGDQEHIVRHWKNQDGSESSEEEIVNIDQDQMSEFDKRWSDSKNETSNSKDNDPNLQNPSSLSSYYDSILDQIFPRRK